MMLHERFFERADRQPDRLALIDGAVRWSYGQLRDEALAIARGLPAAPDHRRAIVAILGKKSAASIAAILGGLAAGYGYLAVDYTLPAARIDAIFRAAAPGALLLTGLPPRLKRQLRAIEERPRAVFDLAGDFAGDEWRDVPRLMRGAGVRAHGSPPLAAEPASGAGSFHDPERSAYILFTSGSTGEPKGVCVSHRAAVAALTMFQEHIGLRDDDRVGGQTALGFDVSMFDIFGSLSEGASLYLFPPAVEAMPKRFLDLLDEMGVTSLFTVPSTLQHVLQHHEARGGKLDQRLVLFSGEAIAAPFLAQLSRFVAPETKIWNLYGGTEMPYVLAKRVDPAHPGEANRFDLRGSGVELACRPLAGEARGRLRVRSAALLSGYLRMSGEFLTPIDDEGFYDTGDAAEVGAGGVVTLCGRVDRQVKIRGHRVDLDEVESFLERQPEVGEAAVILEAMHERLIAGVVVHAGADPEEVRGLLDERCRAELPLASCPSVYRFLERLPRTTSGKKDRQRLLPITAEQASAPFAPPALPGAAPDLEFPDTTVHGLFEAQSVRVPGATAILFGGERMSFGDLNARANRLAHHLRRRGAAGQLVAICLGRSMRVIPALLAILKAGAAYVPLDPSFPDERLRFMLTDSAASLLLTESAHVARFAGATAPIELLDADPPAWRGEPETNPVAVGTPASRAYVIYTSGSTGKPKGVVGLHRCVISRCAWMWHRYPYDADEVGCLKTPLSSVPSLWDIFQPLLAGVPLAVLPPDALADPRECLRLLAAYRVTRVGVVPSLLRVLLDLVDPQLAPRFWECGGEELTLDLVRRFRAALPQARLVNRYGATEATSVLDWEADALDDARVPLGRPIANTRAYIVDEQMREVAPGAAGELCVSGPGLALGYLHHPEWTGQAFVPNPFRHERDRRDWHDRLFRTGDRVRRRPDGNIEFHSRLRLQEKIRGFAVDPGEVEHALRLQPGIAQAVVLGSGDAGARRLVAYCVAAPDAPPLTVDSVRAALGSTLPGYMIPASFVFVDALPLLPNGKLNRNALSMTSGVALGGAAYVPPRDGAERTLARMWEELLGVDAVGVRDDFFSLGGDSILAMRLALRIGTELSGTDFPATMLLAHRTIEDLALLIKRARPGLDAYAPIIPIARGAAPPLFLAPPASGTSFRYHVLAKYLAGRIAILGLETPGLYEGQQPPATIEEAAAGYLGAIRAQQSSGPYRLGGWSHGGVVAFEMARQLREAGEQVDLLLLIDSSVPGPHSRNLGDDEDEDTVIEILKRSQVFPADVPVERMRRMVGNFKAASAAARRYQARRYDGDLLLLRAGVPLPGMNLDPTRPLNGWDAVVTGRIDMHEIAADHNAMLKEGAEDVARRLIEAIGGRRPPGGCDGRVA